MGISGLVAVVFFVAAIAILMLPVVPKVLLISAILVARTLSDVGAASTGSLLPSSLISTALGVLVILAALFPSKSKLSQRKLLYVGLVLLLVALSCLVYTSRFGFTLGALSEPVRIASIIAVLVLAVRYSEEAGEKATKVLSYIPLPAAIVLIIGYMAGQEATMSSGGRATGTFSHPNAAAAFFCLSTLVAVGMALTRKTRVSWALASLSFLSLLFTQSLGSLVALICAVAALVVLTSELSAMKKIAVFIGIFGVGTGLIFYTGVLQRLDEFADMDVSSALYTGSSSNSLEWRLVNWGEYIRILLDSGPLLGMGVGSTYGEIMPLGGPPHSLFVQFLVEYGLIGASVFALIALGSIRFICSIVHTRRGAVLLSVVLILVVLGSESNLFGYTATMYYVAIVFGVLMTLVDSQLSVGSGQSRRELMEIRQK